MVDFIFFSRFSLVLIIFSYGVLIYKSGEKTIIYESTKDGRISEINDIDIINIWHELTELNIQVGWWYKKVIGPFYIIMSFFYMLLLVILNYEAPDLRSGSKSLFYFWSFVITLALLGLTLMHLVTIVKHDGYARGSTGMNLRLYKDGLYILYKRRNKSNNKFKTDNLNLTYMMNTLPYMKLGAIIWHISTIFLTIGYFVQILFHNI